MQNFKCKYLLNGETKTYLVKAQKSKALAMAAWRFYCVKKKLKGAKVLSFEEMISESVKPVVGFRLSVFCFLLSVIYLIK